MKKYVSIKKLIVVNFLFLFLITAFLFFKIPNILAQESSSDAIAIRIIPNPSHLSAQKWYQLQGFSGSPQSIIIDGYKAVRDGRTVYISGANVIGNNLYTNIYLISYDQEADPQTVDIFGRILKNWRLNTNLDDSGNIGYCSISSKSCYQDSDCPESYVCGNNGASLSFQNNKCVIKEDNDQLQNTPSCILDSDCPNNLSCSSLKSKIIRDLDRLEKIILIKDALFEYNKKNLKFPTLGSGTYVSNVVVSTWPSWQNIFLNQIGVSNVSDPINKLGSCADQEKKYDLETCWNATDNTFLNNINSSNFSLPNGSMAMAYITNPNGISYDLCAVMETRLSGINYNLASSTLGSYSCNLNPSFSNIGVSGSDSDPMAPYITESALSGQSGQEFRGFINAVSPGGSPMTWTIQPVNSGVNNFGTWTYSPSGLTPPLLNTNSPNQKMIFAQRAGSPGVYNFIVKITNINGTLTEYLQINISNPEPQIISGDIFHNLGHNNPFLSEFRVNTNNSLQSIKMCPINSSENCIGSYIDITECSAQNGYLGVSLGNNFKACYNVLSPGEYSIKIEGGSLSVGEYSYKTLVKDSYQTENSKNFKIKIDANSPVIDINNCLTVASLGDYYECPIKTFDPSESYTVELLSDSSSLPGGVIFDVNEKKIRGNLVEIVNNREIKFKVTNSHNKSSEKSLFLNVNSDCGTYLISHPGGPWNSSGNIRDHSGYYKTVLIGNQCWLKDNLNVGVFTNISSTTSDSVKEKYCYNNNSLMCDVYGGLYKWTEALQIPSSCLTSFAAPHCDGYQEQGLCPPGWKIPSNDDWYKLESHLKDSSSSCDVSRTNANCAPAGSKISIFGDSGFNALYIGGYTGGNWQNPLDRYSNFWSSSFNSSNQNQSVARILDRQDSSGKITRSLKTKIDAYSVRCVKDLNLAPSVLYFDAQGGSLSYNFKNVVLGLMVGALPSPTRTGYSFLGWYSGVNGTGDYYDSNTIFNMETGSTLYAHWAPNSYTISFDINGSFFSLIPSPISVLFNSQVGNLPGISRTGYNFLGWNTQPNGSGIYYQVSTTYNTPSNITLFAIWSAQNFTLTLNANGGFFGSSILAPTQTTKSVIYDQVVGTLSTPSPGAQVLGGPGKFFLSWNNLQNGSGSTYTSSTVYRSPNNLTIYAKWRYQIKFNPNGGRFFVSPFYTDEPIFLEIEHGQTLSSATIPVATKSGSSFVRWNTAPNGSGADFNPNSPYNYFEPLTVYAIFGIASN